MRRVFRTVDEGSRRGADHLTVDPNGQFALEHVEPLVFVVVDVKWRTRVLGTAVLDNGDPAAGPLRRRFDRGEHSHEPKRFTLTWLQRNRPYCPTVIVIHYSFSLPSDSAVAVSVAILSRSSV